MSVKDECAYWNLWDIYVFVVEYSGEKRIISEKVAYSNIRL